MDAQGTRCDFLVDDLKVGRWCLVEKDSAAVAEMCSAVRRRPN